MSQTNLTFYDFALDEFKYLATAYLHGMRYNAMVSQAQRICELLFKNIITQEMFNNNDIMITHNLRKLYDFLVNNLGYNLADIRSSVMLLNNFYSHTRYPGKDAFMAVDQDISDAFNAIREILAFMQKME